MEDSRQPTEEEKKLGDLVRSHFPGGVIPPFKPCAIYNPELDMIEVLTRDCSLRISLGGIINVLELLEDNFPKKEEDKYVGFQFSPARRLCENWDIIDGQGTVELHRILDRLALKKENDAQGSVIFTAHRLVSEYLFPNTRVKLV